MAGHDVSPSHTCFRPVFECELGCLIKTQDNPSSTFKLDTKAYESVALWSSGFKFDPCMTLLPGLNLLLVIGLRRCYRMFHAGNRRFLRVAETALLGSWQNRQQRCAPGL